MVDYDELIEAINKEIDQTAFVEGYYPFKFLRALREVLALCKQADALEITGVPSRSMISTELLVRTIKQGVL